MQPDQLSWFICVRRFTYLMVKMDWYWRKAILCCVMALALVDPIRLASVVLVHRYVIRSICVWVYWLNWLAWHRSDFPVMTFEIEFLVWLVYQTIWVHELYGMVAIPNALCFASIVFAGWDVPLNFLQNSKNKNLTKRTFSNKFGYVQLFGNWLYIWKQQQPQ